jgi:hypothetical protein
LKASEPETTRPLVWRTWHYRLLWLIALSSFMLNVAMAAVLLNFRARLQEGIVDLNEILEAVELDDIELLIAIDESVPISMTIPFSDTFQVPIRETIPVVTSVLFEDVIQVPINTIIPIDTDFIVQVDIPLVGRTGIPIPIVTNIPVNLTVDVPISREIPVETEIVVDIVVAVPVQSEIPVVTELPVQLDFPLFISPEELGAERLIAELQRILKQLGGGFPGSDP